MASNYSFMKTGSIGDEPIDPELILNVSSSEVSTKTCLNSSGLDIMK